MRSHDGKENKSHMEDAEQINGPLRSTYCWWFRNPAFTSCSLSHDSQVFIHPSWMFRISSINRTTCNTTHMTCWVHFGKEKQLSNIQLSSPTPVTPVSPQTNVWVKSSNFAHLTKQNPSQVTIKSHSDSPKVTWLQAAHFFRHVT